MNAFPSTLPNPSVGSTGSVLVPAIRSTSESNYPSSRKRVTRVRTSWDLKFNYLTYSELATLKEFFEDNQGLVFTWTNPLTGLVYNVIFEDDALSFNMQNTHVSEISIKITEV